MGVGAPQKNPGSTMGVGAPQENPESATDHGGGSRIFQTRRAMSVCDGHGTCDGDLHL